MGSPPVEGARHRGSGATFVLLVHLLAGFVWIFMLGGLAAEALGTAGALVWGGSTAVLWIRAASRLRDEPHFGAACGTSFRWWASSFVAPVVLAVVALGRTNQEPADVTVGPGTTGSPAGDAAVDARFAALEHE